MTIKSASAEEISKIAFLVYRSIMGVDAHADPELLAERLRNIHKGHSPEDEFAATVMWLGNCASIHRIDQTPMPFQVDSDEMRAPDFLAFPRVNGQVIPVLIEVKSTEVNDTSDTALNWSAKYLKSLRTFAERLHLPLLVAWKLGDLWTVVDHMHFEKNVTAYRLAFENALQQDLMCALFRDVRVTMNPTIELIFDLEFDHEVPESLIPEGQYTFKILGAGFYRNGERVTEVFNFNLFLCAPFDTEFRRTGTQTCQQVFRIKPETHFTLSRVLIAQLSLAATEAELDWHRVLANGTFPSKGSDIRDGLRDGLSKGFVQYVMNIIPQTWPDFLPPRNRG